ncbi:MFS transporter [Jiangella alba]|uniref:Predicted arabinose efflux permease, MFS family n=1 Tax=Jiangella alba TaxID=561176 RepID=A0A1H5HVR2_9ACTN|nr:MFS transporter [Jiangella alba]SEE32186.1 Predicted arabinose efflux permease, MFS family [Jiangella alba]
MTERSGDEVAQGILGPAYRRLSVGIVSAVVFIAFESMAVATAMPTAVPELDGMALYAFAFSAFFTTSLFGMVVSGELSDRTGPRLPLILGTSAFTLGLLLSGSAQSMWPFLAGRATQGLGGGLVIVALYVVVGRAYPERMRPKIFAGMAAAWVVPSIVGPLVAGLLTDELSWRWVFLGIAPLVLIPVFLALPSAKAVDGPPPGGAARRAGKKRFALAAAVGVGLLQYAGSRADLVALGVAVVGLALLVPSVPKLLPPGTIWLRRGLPTVVALRGIYAGAFFGTETFLPLLLVSERGMSSTLAGLSLTGGALGWATGSWYQGRTRTVAPRYLLVRAGGVFVALAISSVSLALIDAVPAYVVMLGWAVGAFGMGIATASMSVLLFQLSPVADHGANSASLQVSDALFTATFVGLAGTIFGSAHAESITQTTVDNWVYLVIIGVMAALALFGAWAAGRVRTASDAAPTGLTADPPQPAGPAAEPAG